MRRVPFRVTKSVHLSSMREKTDSCRLSSDHPVSEQNHNKYITRCGSTSLSTCEILGLILNTEREQVPSVVPGSHLRVPVVTPPHDSANKKAITRYSPSAADKNYKPK